MTELLSPATDRNGMAMSWYQVDPSTGERDESSPWIRYWTGGFWHERPPIDMRRHAPHWKAWDDFSARYWNGLEFTDTKSSAGTWCEVDASGERCSYPTPYYRCWDGDGWFGEIHSMADEGDRTWFQWNFKFDRFWDGRGWSLSRPCAYVTEDPHTAYLRGSIPSDAYHMATGDTTPRTIPLARELEMPRLRIGVFTTLHHPLTVAGGLEKKYRQKQRSKGRL